VKASAWAESLRLNNEPNMDHGITWEDDQLFTELLRDSVPVLQHIGWKVLQTGEGYAKTLLPPPPQRKNQLIVLACK
jgi:hypothetical protein